MGDAQHNLMAGSDYANSGNVVKMILSRLKNFQLQALSKNFRNDERGSFVRHKQRSAM